MRKNKLFLMALLFVSAVVLAGVHQLSPVTGVSGLISQVTGDNTTGDGTTTPEGEGQETPDELYQIAERFTSVAELEGQTFAIVNEAEGKALYGSNDQNLGYGAFSEAFAETNTGYLWTIEESTVESGYLLRLQTIAGNPYTIWGSPGYLNSQFADQDCSFILGLNNQNGQDGENLAVWNIEYVEGQGFALKNVGTGLYLTSNAAAKSEVPVYFTFCTIDKKEEPEPEPLFSNGAYYLYNVGTRKYMAAGADWGTHAIVNNTGLDYTLTFANGKYTIDSQINHSDEKHFLNGVWNDDVAFGWTFTDARHNNEFSSCGIFTISDGTRFLTTDDNDMVVFADDGSSDNSRWMLIPAEQHKSDVLGSMVKASSDNGVDVSFFIKGADFNPYDVRNSAWQVSRSGGNYTMAGPYTNMVNYGCEFWNNTFEISQTITDLPAGVYELSVAGFGTNGTTSIFINDNEAAFVNTEGTSSFADAVVAIANGEYLGNTTGKVVVGEDNSLVIGVRRSEQVEADWTVFDKFRLTYYGAASSDVYKTAYDEALAAAQALLSNESYALVTGVEKENLETVISQNSQVENTQEAYEAATAALNEAVNTFKKAKPAYDELAAVREEIIMVNYSDRFPYATVEKKAAAQATLEINVNSAAEATEAINTIYSAYRQVAESSAMLESVEGAVDMTSVIVNPNGSEGVNDPWTLVRGEGSEGSIIIRSGQPLCDGNYNYYNAYFDGGNWDAQAWDVALQQSITLPRGKYQLTVSARASSDVALTVFAGDNTQGIPAIGNMGGLFGNGWNDASVEFELQEQSKIAIGVRGVTEDIHNWMSFTRFRLVQFNGDPLPEKPEYLLTADAWNETEQGGIPAGYEVWYGTEEEPRVAEYSYGSGARMFAFGEGGDFTRGLYLREGYVLYGAREGYKLGLEAGKKYNISFNSAKWKSNGETLTFQIFAEGDMETALLEETVTPNPDVNGSMNAVNGSTVTKLSFVPEADGNYILKWAVDGYREVLIANPTVTHYPAGLSEEQFALNEALMNAKYVLNENADLSESSSYKSLAKYIQDVEEANPTTAEEMISWTEILNNAVKELQEFRSLSKQFSELAILAYYQYQDFAETKFALTEIYERLGKTVTKYIPNGEVPVVNLYSDLVYNVNMFANITNEVSKMFTVGPSTIDEWAATHTGIAVLIDRIRQGAETMRALKIDNEQLLTQADNALTDDDDLAENIKQAITNQLKQAGNNLFEAVIDAETGEEVIPVYNMNVFVKNPNLYVKGEVMPGWDVEGTYNYETGWVPRNDDNIPTDGVIMNWAGTFTASQTITDLPAGIYTVKAAVSERSYTYDLTSEDTYFFVSAGDETVKCGVNYIGQRFPMISNNDEVTIEGVEVVDGVLTLGVQAGEGSHLFFNEVQLLLTAPISEEFVLGDVNLNGEVTTSDAVAAVSIVLEELTPTRSQFLAADVNKSNSITVSDVIGIVNIVLNGDDAGAAGARGDASQNWLTQRATTVGLMNTTEFVGFQMDVTLADGAVLNGVTLNQRAAGLNVKFNRVAGNTYRVVAFSMDKTAIQGHEGELLTLDITGSQEMTLSNIEFTDAAARAYALGLDNTTGIDGIMAGAADAEYYTVDGVKSNTMRKGFNVVRTADGKVHKVFVK